MSTVAPQIPGQLSIDDVDAKGGGLPEILGQVSPMVSDRLWIRCPVCDLPGWVRNREALLRCGFCEEITARIVPGPISG